MLLPLPCVRQRGTLVRTLLLCNLVHLLKQFSSDDRVRAISLAMGLVPVLWTATPDGGKFDSFGSLNSRSLCFSSCLASFVDWRVAAGEFTGEQSVEVFQTIMKNGSNFPTGYVDMNFVVDGCLTVGCRFISLQHDLFEITVDLAVGYTLDAAVNHVPKFAVSSS